MTGIRRRPDEEAATIAIGARGEKLETLILVPESQTEGEGKREIWDFGGLSVFDSVNEDGIIRFTFVADK